MPALASHPRVSRRGFIAGSAAASVSVATLGHSRWALASPGDPGTGDIVVVIFLRGGADGLSLVAPYADGPGYQTLRPDLRVRPPGQPGGGIDLERGFALHPALGDFPATSNGPANAPGLTQIWNDGNLAVVHAVGLPGSESRTRSHFDAMNYWEWGTANTAVRTGWLARHLNGLPPVQQGAITGVGRDNRLQMMLRGSRGAMAMDSIGGFTVRGFDDTAAASATLDQLYASNPTIQSAPGELADLVDAGAATHDALGLVAPLRNATTLPIPENLYPQSGLGRDLAETARLIKANIGMRAGVIDNGGWDTHSDMGLPDDPNGRMYRLALNLGQGLGAFYTDLRTSLGDTAFDEITVMVMSEFGRTIEQNGSAGVDHGRGSSMFVISSNVNRGVFGAFPQEGDVGPAVNDTPHVKQGPEGDLEVVTDYRTVVAEILTKRTDSAAIDQIFPTYDPAIPALGLIN